LSPVPLTSANFPGVEETNAAKTIAPVKLKDAEEGSQEKGPGSRIEGYSVA